MRTENYSTFLKRIAGLIGVASSDLQTEEKAIINGYFNHSVRDGWEANYWLDLVTKGEARFVGNLVPYPHVFSTVASGWTVTSNTTVTDNQVANPLDGGVTAGFLSETSVVSTTHGITSTSFRTLPSTSYTVSAYVRPGGRNYCRLSSSDATGPIAFFNVFTGAIVSQTNCVASCGVVANGFSLCSFTFTTSATATTSAITLYASNDGSTISYAGTFGLGLYVYGITSGAANNAPLNQLVAFRQSGETEIEAFFNIYKQPPSAVRYPTALPYYLTPAGAQLVGAGSGGNPVYVDYRPACPSYTGDNYSVSTAYAVGDQMYYTALNLVTNYWRCVVATTAGQSPETTPASWSVITIPLFLLDFCVYDCYSQWLNVEGRTGAAELMANRAQQELDEESDRQERQMGEILPTKYQTHVSVQPR